MKPEYLQLVINDVEENIQRIVNSYGDKAPQIKRYQLLLAEKAELQAKLAELQAPAQNNS